MRLGGKLGLDGVGGHGDAPRCVNASVPSDGGHNETEAVTDIP